MERGAPEPPSPPDVTVKRTIVEAQRRRPSSRKGGRSPGCTRRFPPRRSPDPSHQDTQRLWSKPRAEPGTSPTVRACRAGSYTSGEPGVLRDVLAGSDRRYRSETTKVYRNCGGCSDCSGLYCRSMELPVPETGDGPLAAPSRAGDRPVRPGRLRIAFHPVPAAYIAAKPGRSVGHRPMFRLLRVAWRGDARRRGLRMRVAPDARSEPS